MIKLNGVEVKPTIFPDGTSQVWKLEESDFSNINVIQWDFENEGELIQVMQLATLCKSKSYNGAPLLWMPFLPYGRQDKMVSNTTTFALSVFLGILSKSDLFQAISTLDAHNPKSLEGYAINTSPNVAIRGAITLSNPALICFPDKGAANRGYTTEGLPNIVLDKKRNQITGQIEGLEYKGDLNLVDKNILIVDDLCDGGRTFVEAAKLLYDKGAFSVYLYTTHGIYSKGVQVLKDAGIKRVFNYKGEV